jgi:hypothetical protein
VFWVVPRLYLTGLHLRRIHKRFGARNTAQAILMASQAGEIEQSRLSRWPNGHAENDRFQERGARCWKGRASNVAASWIHFARLVRCHHDELSVSLGAGLG